mgnify:CR=1 FL=1|jgi:hypothetical protein
MQRVKRRIFSGVVCEQEVYTVSDRTNIKKAEPRPRFKDDEERAQHRIGISKRKHQRLVNENFSPLSLYSTLTFDDDSEVHTFSEARRIRDNYFRRLQRACPDAKIIIYMGRGKSTNRIHFHMISDGIPEETISGKWNDGSVIHIRHLREHNYYNGVDYGQDYTGLADYLFNHWTPEQGGHRWQRAIFASRRRKRRRLRFGRIRKRKHRSRRRVTSWWKPARRSGATYIINMYANRRNRNAGRNANSGNARRGAIKSLVNV